MDKKLYYKNLHLEEWTEPFPYVIKKLWKCQLCELLNVARLVFKSTSHKKYCFYFTKITWKHNYKKKKKHTSVELKH